MEQTLGRVRVVRIRHEQWVTWSVSPYSLKIHHERLVYAEREKRVDRAGAMSTVDVDRAAIAFLLLDDRDRRDLNPDRSSRVESRSMG